MIVDQIIFGKREGERYKRMDGHPPKPQTKILWLAVIGKEDDGSEFKHGLEVECDNTASDELDGVAQLFRVLGASFTEAAKLKLGATPEERVKKWLQKNPFPNLIWL